MTIDAEDCPCCFQCLAPGLDTDRALVAAFLTGGAARDNRVPLKDALCPAHLALAREAIGYIEERAPSCPRCFGPMIRTPQTGKLSCAHQCDEKMIDAARRLALEGAVGELAKVVGSRVPREVGFVLVLFNFGNTGNMAYASSGDRADVTSMLRELLDHILVERRS